MFLSQLKEERALKKVSEIKVVNADGAVSYQAVDGSHIRVAADEQRSSVIEAAYDPVAAEIISNRLFLGSQDSMANLDTLRSNAITHVLHVAFCERPEATKELGVAFESIPIYDTDDQPLLDTLDLCCTFIDSCERVLVTCNAGVSRSASVVIGYLMKRKGMSLDEAHALVLQKRPSIRPNAGFLGQLRNLDGQQH